MIASRITIFLPMFFCLWSVFSLPFTARALEPDEIVVVANGQESDGVGLARFYMKKRGIPNGNLLVIRTAANEGI
ncbi:MAG TPA: hypothetical protein EYG88_11860, partial [Desulfocapsa sulfexigens]|nr:hypothetical protein [Desulfocapsa sulfexigens]